MLRNPTRRCYFRRCWCVPGELAPFACESTVVVRISRALHGVYCLAVRSVRHNERKTSPGPEGRGWQQQSEAHAETGSLTLGTPAENQSKTCRQRGRVSGIGIAVTESIQRRPLWSLARERRSRTWPEQSEQGALVGAASQGSKKAGGGDNAKTPVRPEEAKGRANPWQPPSQRRKRGRIVSDVTTDSSVAQSRRRDKVTSCLETSA